MSPACPACAAAQDSDRCGWAVIVGGKRGSHPHLRQSRASCCMLTGYPLPSNGHGPRLLLHAAAPPRVGAWPRATKQGRAKILRVFARERRTCGELCSST